MQQQQQASSSSSALASVRAERRRSDPALHDMDMLTTSTHNYSTVTGISALRLANYQKARCTLSTVITVTLATLAHTQLLDCHWNISVEAHQLPEGT